MAIKKSELYNKLWKSCDELRGGMDASQYKNYILILLFMRYVTDKYYGKKDALIYVPEGGSFKDLMELKGDKEIGDKTNKIIRKMADENDLVGVITVADFNDSDKLGKGKEMVDRLSNLIAIFEDEKLNFGSNTAEGDDILGDAYEYLMKHFATESGKSKGQFYTPAEVSRIMAQVIGVESIEKQSQTVYDPTAGSGSLLLKVADESGNGLTLYGQEKDVATVALAKMNMILHNNELSDIRQGDTLSSPEFRDKEGKLKTFDFAVANPPFSTKSWSNGFDPANDLYKRFDGYGLPPAKNGDYAFLLHLIKSLKSNKGKGAIILPHGVLFRGNAEATIRENIIKRGYIKGIIGLPANLFYGTGIPAAIIVIDKANASVRKGIFMIDASKGFIKDGNKNRLREQDIHKIVDVFNNKTEIPKYSRMIPIDEIKENEYNLNIPRYIDNTEEEDIQDIRAHLSGGIPNRDIDELEKYWEVYPKSRNTLFSNSEKEGYSKLNVEKENIKETIFNDEEFINYRQEINTIINNWSNKYREMFRNIKTGSNPKEIIEIISEDILEKFDGRILIDKYDIYQYLMNYWLDTMKDDTYMIVENGWIADKDLVPQELIIDKYFIEEKEYIEAKEVEKDEISREKEEYEEEHSEEEGILEEIKNDKGNITKGNLKSKIKETKDNEDYKEEYEVLNNYLKLVDNESKANKEIKKLEKELNKKVDNKYKELSEDQIKGLVIDYKWVPTITKEVNGELERISHRLTTRIKELAERYDEPLPQIEEEIKELESKVEGHLKRMGFSW
ncbi:type I restriction-modification system subunit M [Senegalia sp. (in: firmicutes)]|uniref:type I restriction-modification system subunit M n=1 Tax=Senegalia sp. (in: firmicutes) TaxID=1924098 RepID=UPI003F9C0BB8